MTTVLPASVACSYLFKDLGFDLYRRGPRWPRRLAPYSGADECFLTTNSIAAR